MSPNDAEGMANSVDPDQTAPEEQSDLGLHCLPRHICPKTLRYMAWGRACCLYLDCSYLYTYYFGATARLGSMTV